jgi:dihydropteroate synthase
MHRATSWQLRTRRLDFPRRPLLMGILNVTPDSFSDGGRFFEPDIAIEHGLRMAAEGADIIDIGGESTRPYSEPIDAAEELKRVLPVVRELSQRTTAIISIDTSKAEVINDVTALGGDEAMLPLAVKSKAGVCAMHMLGTPQTMQDDPQYDDVVAEVLAWLCRRRDLLLAAGIEPSRLCLDPGIGFGKSHQHNLTLLANCWRFHALDCPLLIGHSRKGFIAHVIADKQIDRTPGTIGVSIALANQGVQILRVHDVAPIRQALLLYETVGGLSSN